MARKIAASVRTLGLSRFDLKYDIGRLPARHRAASIELYGREVVPRVREMIANDSQEFAAGMGNSTLQ